MSYSPLSLLGLKGQQRAYSPVDDRSRASRAPREALLREAGCHRLGEGGAPKNGLDGGCQSDNFPSGPKKGSLSLKEMTKSRSTTWCPPAHSHLLLLNSERIRWIECTAEQLPAAVMCPWRQTGAGEWVGGGRPRLHLLLEKKRALTRRDPVRRSTVPLRRSQNPPSRRACVSIRRGRYAAPPQKLKETKGLAAAYMAMAATNPTRQLLLMALDRLGVPPLHNRMGPKAGGRTPMTLHGFSFSSSLLLTWRD